MAAPDQLFTAFQTAIAGRYSIDRELGRGGMGIVYLAHEVHLDRYVAIKLLPPELAERPALRDRFIREAQLAAKLSHPNIIPIIAVEQTDTFVFYVMAYVDGETLAQRVQSRGPVLPGDGIRMLREVAWALGYAHAQGIVHRDIKPDNILIEASTGRALVADFGIAAAIGEARGDGVSGTPEFMSPEQALGEDAHAQSDLYSLGATAFYALSAQLPFEGNTTAQVLARQVTAAAPSLISVAPTTPRKLAQLIDRCLSKEPSHRPASAQVLADALGLAIEKRRELPAALRAFVKRNGRMDGGGTLLALMGALAASVGASALVNVAFGVIVLGASFAVIPMAFGIAAAKRLLDVGFTQSDLGPAFQAEQESAREERSVQHRSGFTWRGAAEKLFGRIARTAGAVSTVLAVLALSGVNTPRFALIGTVALATVAVALTSTFGYMVLVQMRRDVDVEFWSAVWTGRMGRAAFAIARKLRGAKPMTKAMTHRATELSLGMAAEDLFRSLPKSSRDALGDVPDLVQRLQRDAALLRARYDALQDAIANASAEQSEDAAQVLREERDTMLARMRESVATLENIRLGLLRLHAGALTLEGMTTHIEQAADVSQHLDRLVSAQSEVRQLLHRGVEFPAQVELTPV